RQLATCAHVVNMALRRQSDVQEPPSANEAVTIRFMADPKKKFAARLVNESDWNPPPRGGSDGRDVCILQLDEYPPARARVARFAVDDDLRDLGSKSFRAIGYPPG